MLQTARLPQIYNFTQVLATLTATSAFALFSCSSSSSLIGSVDKLEAISVDGVKIVTDGANIDSMEGEAGGDRALGIPSSTLHMLRDL